MSFQLFVYYFSISFFFFFLNYTAPTEISTLSLHDALPIYGDGDAHRADRARSGRAHSAARRRPGARSEEHTSELQSHSDLVCRLLLEKKKKKKQQNIYAKTITIHTTIM